MEEYAKRVEAVLERAEEELRDVIREAAKVGDYPGVDLSRGAAGRIRQMIEELTFQPAVPSAGETGEVSPVETGKSRHVFRVKGKGKKTEYPKFFVRKQVLHKIGWSKKERSEYAHKIPKEAYDQTVAAIAGLVQSGKSPFAAEQILEQLQRANLLVPIYQVYTALAFLRERGLLERKGREGYMAGGNLLHAAAAAWDELRPFNASP